MSLIDDSAQVDHLSDMRWLYKPIEIPGTGQLLILKITTLQG